MNAIPAWLMRHNASLTIIAATAAILVAAIVINVLLNRLMERSLKGLEQRFALHYETLLTVTRIITGLFWLITSMLILSLWGVSVSGLWTLLVSAAAVIGVGFLAVWTMISNVTASLFITIWRPFQFGQTVELLPENLKGRVIGRNMMFTVLREGDGTLLHVPNNLFFQKIFRVSGSSELSRFESLESQDRPGATKMTPGELR